MNPETLERAIALANRQGHIFVATADGRGLPHVAAAGKMNLLPARKGVAVEAWFCPGTVANLGENRRTSLVIWDPRTDEGYQILGEVEEIEEVAMMDGIAPDMEDPGPLPQVDRRLSIRVDKILGFRHAPHTDEAE
jgi:hypothetical protein